MNLVDKAVEIRNTRQSDPVYWIENCIGKRLSNHQRAIVRDKNTHKIGVWGRRTGKSTCIYVDALHRVMTKPNYRIGIFCQSSTMAFIDLREIIHNSPVLYNSLLGSRRATSYFDFKNGSSIRVVSPQTRGFSLNYVYADEIDYIGEETAAIYASMLYNEDDSGSLLMGTPRARDGYLRHLCENEQYSVHHQASSYIQEGLRDEVYRREVLAEFV